MRKEATYRVVEIGATKTRRAEVTLEKAEVRVLDYSSIPTSELFISKNLPEEIIKFAYGKGLKKEIKAIVYLLAGSILDHQIVEFSPNISELPRNINLVKLTKERVKSPSIVLNDMEAAVTGIAYLLKKENWQKPFWGITWSSGIGGRYWDGNQILGPSEIGHITLDTSPSAPLCGCGKRGHVEALIGGKAIERRLLSEFRDKKTFDILNRAYQNKEDWAVKFYKKSAQVMGIFLANLSQINQAQMVCFKGTLALHVLKLPGLKEEIIETVAKSVVSPSWAIKDIQESPEPEKDSLIGAALYASRFLK